MMDPKRAGSYRARTRPTATNPHGRIKMLETRQVVRDPNDQAASAELTATATKTPSAEEANGETPGPASANSGSQEPCGDDQTTAQSRTNRPVRIDNTD